jgi:hypothetical protein
MGKPWENLWTCLLNIHEIPYDVLVGGLEHDWIMTFQKQLGIITPTDELIFFRGVGIPPTRISLKMGGTLTSLNLAS